VLKSIYARRLYFNPQPKKTINEDVTIRLMQRLFRNDGSTRCSCSEIIAATKNLIFAGWRIRKPFAEILGEILYLGRIQKVVGLSSQCRSVGLDSSHSRAVIRQH